MLSLNIKHELEIVLNNFVKLFFCGIILKKEFFLENCIFLIVISASLQLKLQSSKIVTLFIKLISWLNTSFFWYISTYFNYADWTFWRCLSIVYCNLLAREEFWNSSKVLFIAIFWHDKGFQTFLMYRLLQFPGTASVLKLLLGVQLSYISI